MQLGFRYSFPGFSKMRWQALLPILFLVSVVVVFFYSMKTRTVSLEEQVRSKEKVERLWDRPLPWYPNMDSFATGLKTSPDGVKMPIGWPEL